jgi:hypothetical protein
MAAYSAERECPDGLCCYNSPMSVYVMALLIGVVAGLRAMTAPVGRIPWPNAPHTTRAAMTGLRKRGFAIERTRHEKLGSLYRIVGDQTAPVGA